MLTNVTLAGEGITDEQDEHLAQFIERNPRLFVLTGAGCSTASGLGDYRDQAGQWKRPQPITGQTFLSNIEARKRYWARSAVGWPAFSKAKPSASHSALRQLQHAGRLTQLVTQNVDRLHQKAGHEHVIDLHGALDTVSCLQCRHTLPRDEFQIQLLGANTWLSSLDGSYAPDGDADLDTDELQSMLIPGCNQCNGIMKPDVVFFGENVPRATVERAMDALAASDALLVVGSSLMVYSGFRFCREAQKRQQPIAIINQGLTRADDLAYMKIDGDCGARLTNCSERFSN